MNIFAKIIYTSEENIKNEIINSLKLNLKEKTTDLEIYSKLEADANIVLIYSKNNFEKITNYSKENFEIVKFFNIGTALSLDDLDIISGDVMIPNTFINEKNEVVFLEYLVEKNYDLNNFGLILNGICLTKEEDIKDELELQEIRENFSSEIFDKEAYYIAKELEKNELLEKSCIIKIIGKDEEFIKNGLTILEIML